MKKYILMGVLALTSLTFTACRNGDDTDSGDANGGIGGGQNSNSPLVGNWRFVAFVENGNLIDITPAHIPCFKNSTLSVNANNYTLNYFAPKQQGSTECNSVTLAGTWRFDGSRHYVKRNGSSQEEDMQASFNDNNTTLQFPTQLDNGSTVILVFKKQ